MSATPKSLLTLASAALVLLVAAVLPLWRSAPPPVAEAAGAGSLAPVRTAAVEAAAAVEREPIEAARAPLESEAPAVPAVSVAPASVRGQLAGQAPGYGATWILEAYRVTASRSTTVEHRRAFADPTGAFAFEGLAPGAWQLAVVAPHFAWGPLVELAPGSAADGVVLPRPGAGVLHVDLVAGAHWQRNARARVELYALQGPELEGSTVRVRVPVTARELRIGEPCVIEALAEGRFEVSAALLDAPPPGWERSRACAEVGVGTGQTQVELCLAEAVAARG